MNDKILTAAKGQWIDIYNDGTMNNAWTRNLVVSNANKVISVAVGNQPFTDAINLGGANWTAATKVLTKTSYFSLYKSQWTDTDYFVPIYGTGLTTFGTQFKIASADSSGNFITLESSIGADVSDSSLSGVIFKRNPRFHNLYLALGTGSSSWDFEMPYPSKSATALTQEYYRKPVSRVTNIKEYEGTVSSSTAATVVSADFSQFGADGTGQLIEIVDGTGANQVRKLGAYTASSNTYAITPNWVSNPDATSKWRIGVPNYNGTGIIEIQTDFTAEEVGANGSIRETGIFGADATNVLGSGQLFNLVHHAVMTKTTVGFTRIFRLRFEVV